MRSVLSLLLILPLTLPAQTPEPNVRTTVSEILLDVVVRDKKAHIIRDLRPEEVQVFEDGVPQKLRHFEFFDGRSTVETSPAATAARSIASPASSSPARDVNELRDISVVSIVIATMDPRGRKLTLDSVREFIKNELRPNTYVGVFRLDFGGLDTVQSYTNDPGAITNGVAKAVRTPSTILTDQSPEVERAVRAPSASSADQPTGEITDSTVPGPTTASATGPAAAIAQIMEVNWVNEMHDVYQGSMAYLMPLDTLVRSQAEIPGRKVVLLFSAGLPVSADTHELLRTVISTANRSNVSVYAVDTRGYSQDSDLDNSRRLLTKAMQSSRNRQLSIINGGDQTVSPAEATSTDIAQNSIHANVRENLAELAKGTGGDLLPDALDLREPLRRAMEDVRTHYELSYSPTNIVTDGSFRKIEVKVSRPGAMVFARSGYYALPQLNGRQVYPFEMATLKALNTRPQLRQFDFHAAALHFRPGPDRTQLTFVFQTPIQDLAIEKDKQWAKVHVCVTALIRNEQGEVVQKISKDIPYEVPAARTTELQRGLVSFTAPFLLAPGRYTLETAAVDRDSMKASVSRSALIVQPAAPFSVSDVALVRRLDAIQGPTSAFDPLEARGGKITPELSDVISPEAGRELKFYAIAYPAPPADGPVEVNVEIWRDGKLVVQTPATQVPLDATGAASILASVPLEHLPAGQYEAQVSFQYKGHKATKMTAFTLAAGS